MKKELISIHQAVALKKTIAQKIKYFRIFYQCNSHILAKHISLSDLYDLLMFTSAINLCNILNIASSSKVFNYKETKLANNFLIIKYSLNNYHLLIIPQNNKFSNENKGTYKTLTIGIDLTANKVKLIAMFKCIIEDEYDLNTIINEIEISRKLTHPNLFKYYLSQTPNNITPTILEFYGDLLQYNLAEYILKIIKLNDKQEIESLLQGIRQLFSAIEHMHSKGYVHQDIKPKNIMIQENNQQKKFILIDYGFTVKHLSNEHHPLATAYYESPEIYKYYKILNKSGQDYENQYAYFNQYPSIARTICKYKKEIKIEPLYTPHEANDLWAIAVTILYMITKGKTQFPSYAEVAPKSKFMTQLFNLKYQQRPSCTLALEQFNEYGALEIKELLNQTYQLNI